MTDDIRIEAAAESDRTAILDVHRAAFGQEDEARLVADLLADPTARPLLSLLARRGNDVIGHVLFSAARLDGAGRDISCRLLAPLAVLPQAQSAGVGSRLVKGALDRLRVEGAALIFVLGDPAYYGRFGFTPARGYGLAAPYSLSEAYVDAWMVLALQPGLLDGLSGRLHCAECLDRPEYWQE